MKQTTPRLLLYRRVLGRLAAIAADTTSSSTDLSALRDPSPVRGPRRHGPAAVGHSDGAVVYKPKAMTRYGRRKQRESVEKVERRFAASPTTHPPAIFTNRATSYSATLYPDVDDSGLEPDRG